MNGHRKRPTDAYFSNMAIDPSPYQPQLLAGLTELVAAFDRHGIRYALIGGLAISLRSRPRSTRDIDFLLTVPQMTLPRLLQDLTEHGFTLDEMSVITAFVRHHITAFEYKGVRVDWLKPVVPMYQHVLDTAAADDGFGRPVRVASSEGLILLKLMAGRPQDLVDIDSLLAANKGQIDLDWIEHEWLTLYATDDPRWQKFRQSVAEYYER
jgi:hypothetical protein